MAADPLGVQPGPFGLDQILGFAEPGEHLPDVRRIRRAIWSDFPLDPVPGVPHECDPAAFGKVARAGHGHPGQVVQDEPVAGQVRRDLHAQIIPLILGNVESMT
jgi:hypothetical protein